MNLKSRTPFVQRALFILLGGLIASSQLVATEKARPIRLVITGNLMGAIIDCRCPHGQPGGLARRKTIFDRIRKESPDAVFIDCGRITGSMTGAGESEVSEGWNVWELTGWLMDSLNYNLVCPYIMDFDRLSGCGARIALPYSFTNLERFTYINSFGGTVYDGLRDCLTELSLKRPMMMQLGGQNILFATYTDYTDETDTTMERRLAYLCYLRQDDIAMPDTGEIGILRWDGFTLRFPVDVNRYPGLVIFVRNLGPDEDELPVYYWAGGGPPRGRISKRQQSEGKTYDSLCTREELWWHELDLLIVGGGGFVEAEVKQQDGFLVAYPGLYGGYVLVVDLWTKDGKSVSRYEWEAIPTETAAPDSAFNARLTADYKQLEALPGK